MNHSKSPLQQARLAYKPPLPLSLANLSQLALKEEEIIPCPSFIEEKFPLTCSQPIVSFFQGRADEFLPLKIGVVLSGGQASGGHNVIAGLFDALKKLHPVSSLIGFLDGPAGIISNKWVEINADLLLNYRNQGGFDIIGSGRTKIEKEEQFQGALATVRELGLDGLVVIGGDDSNTNAAFLAEVFKKNGQSTCVVGVPKTIDGDLKNSFIELSFGFDTATKIYAEIIGNIQTDASSSKKYYHFIKLMGRSASHITLECALQTHPNLALIGEEVAQRQLTLRDVVLMIADLVRKRADNSLDYGVILVPEGLIEFVSDIKEMIKELNSILASDQNWVASHAAQLDYLLPLLSHSSTNCLKSLPELIQRQLLLERDAHGNVQVSKIETERLLLELVQNELELLKKQGVYKGKFNPQPQFCGYEGRSALPTNFDAAYCYALGFAATLLIQNKKNGYMACIKGLTKPVEEWSVLGVPITSMLGEENREGKKKIVIQKALVDLNGFAFQKFCKMREEWGMKDDYQSPGPIQFAGPSSVVDRLPLILEG
ncbi:MAG: diphosphate--fructose-6-phosphate 1-phosphotransferase [Parachlamydia sp.]|jgi:pyrophosphate--fructose-6-phosphate 1-phosphotransferase|nr:diphosphate--fructose-6-phosphate 1-phosphotransferase [Parachlamydia sp.]